MRSCKWILFTTFDVAYVHRLNQLNWNWRQNWTNSFLIATFSSFHFDTDIIQISCYIFYVSFLRFPKMSLGIYNYHKDFDFCFPPNSLVGRINLSLNNDRLHLIRMSVLHCIVHLPFNGRNEKKIKWKGGPKNIFPKYHVSLLLLLLREKRRWCFIRNTNVGPLLFIFYFYIIILLFCFVLSNFNL